MPLPGIAFRNDDCGRATAWVVGTAFDVWQVADALRDFGSVERMVAEGNLTEGQIRVALEYYERFPDEIDRSIAANRRPLEALRAAFPFIEVR